jgi:hypothetical protein
VPFTPNVWRSWTRIFSWQCVSVGSVRESRRRDVSCCSAACNVRSRKRNNKEKITRSALFSFWSGRAMAAFLFLDTRVEESLWQHYYVDS